MPRGPAGRDRGNPATRLLVVIQILAEQSRAVPGAAQVHGDGAALVVAVAVEGGAVPLDAVPRERRPTTPAGVAVPVRPDPGVSRQETGQDGRSRGTTQRRRYERSTEGRPVPRESLDMRQLLQRVDSLIVRQDEHDVGWP